MAVAVLALTLPALLFALQGRADAAAHLRDQTLAQWVAANRLAELRIRRHVGAEGQALDTVGIEEMGGRRWRWQLRRQETPVAGFYRVDVDVSPEDAEDDEVVTTLSGFIALETGDDT